MAAIKINTVARVTPQCYAYTTPGVPAHNGWTKIGFTEREDVDARIKEQTYTAGITPHREWVRKAEYSCPPYDTFMDHDFHAYLKKLGVEREKGHEWFRISPSDAEHDFDAFIKNHGVIADDEADAVIPYKLRDEQEAAVEQTITYFKGHTGGEYLWNAKPRFGKTLSSYDLCARLDARNILIVTNRPAIANSWFSDYKTFFGPQSGYLFVSNVDGIKDKPFVFSREEYLDKLSGEGRENIKGCIEFVSLQDLKGSIYFGGQYEKLSELDSQKGMTWDIMIIDEAHEGVDTYKTDTAFDHIKRRWTLHLSGTPFKALANEKFKSNAIYNWTYADEQKKKRDWKDSSEIENPYKNLPRLSLFTYQMSDIIRDKVSRGIKLDNQDSGEYAFDLNEFFATNESGKFIHDTEVDKFLDALTHQEKFPFSTPQLRDELKHTFWLLNRVASAKALAKKLHLHPVFKEYEIILAAGDGKLEDDDENEKAFDRVTKAIKEHDKTITLSVGQLTTGVTIPEWTAVLMLSNMSSAALYMQAAFRAQNPCLFTDKNGCTWRKKNAYVFDFDPARTLDIFDQFANNLNPDTAAGKGDIDVHKRNVRELLNFFPVYGEDEQGAMIELDAEKVLTIPRHIHAKEVVGRGFMSNFLFDNISGIFGAPKEVIELINNMEAIEEPNKLSPVTVNENTAEELNLNDEGEVEIPHEQIIGTASKLFGDKVYGEINDRLVKVLETVTKEYEQKPNAQKDELKRLCEEISNPFADTLMETAQRQYGPALKKSTQNQLKRKIQQTTDRVIKHEYGEYQIRDNQLIQERDAKISRAQKQDAAMTDITKIKEEYGKRRQENHQAMMQNIQQGLKDNGTVNKAGAVIIETVETEKKNNVKDSIEGSIRDHLRGFSRTIPAFLMAYGTRETTLANFDTLVPEDVFLEVTANPQTGKGVTLKDFRFLRDGGEYTDDTGKVKHYDGHLFDEVVFNDAVQEFMNKREELADYFDETSKGDIFDYIPNQRTNQIFTPKQVVQDMVDRLEQENPGCFDDPNNTFADLYMKSGMYITEIVKRLYRSPKLKILYPDKVERLNHIFANQVYGCAPTKIIYRICQRYILGFDAQIPIKKNNIKLCDTLQYAKNGTLDKELEKLFDL